MSNATEMVEHIRFELYPLVGFFKMFFLLNRRAATLSNIIFIRDTYITRI